MVISTVAESFATLGSDAPGGGVTLAVLASMPAAPAAIVAVAVKVTVALTGALTEALMFPVPADAGHAPPPVAAHVHVTPVSTAAKLSATTAPMASLGPLLFTVITYVVVAPGIAVEAALVLVMPRSVARAANEALALAVLLPPAGSVVEVLVAVAVFVIGFGAV